MNNISIFNFAKKKNIFRVLDQLFNYKLGNLQKNYESSFYLPYTYDSPLHSMKIVVIMPHGVASTMRHSNYTICLLRRIFPSVSHFWLESSHFREFEADVYPNLHQ